MVSPSDKVTTRKYFVPPPGAATSPKKRMRPSNLHHLGERGL